MSRLCHILRAGILASLTESRFVRCAFAVMLSFIAGSAALAQDKNSGGHWVSVQSKEGKSGPRLILKLANGSSKDRSVVQDSTVISYLSERAWGHMPWLAIDLSGRNQTLLQFEIPADIAIQSAELRMTPTKDNPSNPPQPFDVELFALDEKWDEKSTAWKTIPKHGAAPVQTATINPKLKDISLDVTKAVLAAQSRKQATYGWLIRVAKPLAAPEGVGTASKEIEEAQKKLLTFLPWQQSLDQAKRLAKEQNKKLLVLVGASFEPNKLSQLESMLLEIAFTDPMVLELVKSEFVPVRVVYSPIVHISGEMPNAKDPLKSLGLTAKEMKAPALLVFDSQGKQLASMTSVGAFHHSLIHQFLIGDAKRLTTARQLHAIKDKPSAKLALANLMKLQDNLEDCELIARELVEAKGAELQSAQSLLAYCLLAKSNFKEAEKLLAESLNGLKSESALQAKYLRAVCLARMGQRDESIKLLKELASQSELPTISVRAAARLAWPEAMNQSETFVPAHPTSDLITKTEHDGRKNEDRIVKEGLRYLLSQQSANGTWNAADQSMYAAAVTALVSRSLLGWSEQIENPTKNEILSACDKATRWLNDYLDKVDPATCESFGSAYLLEYFLDLEERKAATQGNTKKAIAVLLGGQCPHGGWSYNKQFAIGWRGGFGGWPKTDKGREHSMNTGPAMLALTRAKRLGQPVGDKPLEAGKKSLLAMRDAAGVYTYTYPEPRCFNKPDSSIGRACACELSLYRLDSSTNNDMEKTIDLFLQHRKGLRIPVKLTESWLPPLGVSNYFYFFAYNHAAHAIVEHNVKVSERLAILRDDLLSVVELDSTWVDFPEIGKPYATAMALDVIRLARLHPAK